MGAHSPKWECWGKSSVFKLRMGVASPQFKWASWKVRGTEWDWKKGSWATSEVVVTSKSPKRVVRVEGGKPGQCASHMQYLKRRLAAWWKPSFEHLWCHCHQRSVVEDVWTFLELDFMSMSEWCKSKISDKRWGTWWVCFLVSPEHVGYLLIDTTIQLLKLLSAFKHTEPVPMLHSCYALSVSTGQIILLLFLSANNSPI